MMMMGGHRLRIRELFGLSRLSLALSSNGSAIALQKRGAMMEGWRAHGQPTTEKE
jgi:hypothetical protein